MKQEELAVLYLPMLEDFISLMEEGNSPSKALNITVMFYTKKYKSIMSERDLSWHMYLFHTYLSIVKEMFFASSNPDEENIPEKAYHEFARLHSAQPS